ncbi:hypothetical protein [Aeromonas allosaccharophila]|uniref:hypothetical protein n=1 Tax=Aeromonas allosaccharophila TaxID=656 RepID=UPI003D1E4F57
MNKSPHETMRIINDKFNDNFELWYSLTDHKLEKTFIGLQCISLIGEILSKKKISKHHDICCKIYDEIFSDGVSSIYLASHAMDKPANIILRRIIELGLASIYLWDMPHAAYSWNDYDHDLSFSEMMNHVNSKGYIAYVNSENNGKITSELFSSSRAQKIYGNLSDIIHGKITTFETSTPDRFKFSNNDWNSFIELIEEVVTIIIKALFNRFDISRDVFEKIPLARMEFN